MLNPFNHTVNDIKKNIVRRDTWGDYIVIDDFLKVSVFEELCKDFNYWKTEDDGIWSGQENPRVWRFTEPKGMNLIIGGAGTEVKHFNKLCSLSKTWKEFIEVIHSDESHKYFIDIFSDTKSFEDAISDQDLKDSVISCKLSAQLNNYGFIIHPDAAQKLVSYLFYLDTYGWNKDSEGGTDLWEVLDHEVEYSDDESSIEYQMRDGRLWKIKKPSIRLTEDEAKKVNKFKSIDFKPNRMVGFVRTNKSYHSIPPRVLPSGMTRDCFQINIWNLRSRKK